LRADDGFRGAVEDAEPPAVLLELPVERSEVCCELGPAIRAGRLPQARVEDEQRTNAVVRRGRCGPRRVV
jgi:hypothetical protein